MRYLNMGEERIYKSGDVILKSGQDEHEEIFYVIEGEVSLSIENDSKKVYEQAIVKDELFGMVAPFVDKKPVENVTAVSDCKIYVWSKTAFIDAVGMYQELAKLSIVMLSKRLRSLNSVLAGTS